MTETIIKKEKSQRDARIAIMCCDDPHHFYLINQLKQHFNIAGIVLEPNRNQMAWLWKKKRYQLWLYRRYHSWRRRIIGHSKHRKAFFPVEFNIKELDIPVQEVFNINDKASAHFLNKIEPDITIVCGTMYVGRRARKAGNVIINLHGGVLPDYKGNQCIFFALYEKNYDKIGATIHLVSEQLDGGSIIEIIRPEIESKDNDETLYAKSLKLCVDALVQLLQKYDQGYSIIAKVQEPSNKKTYSHRHRTPLVEIRHYLNRFFHPMKTRKLS